MNPNPTAFSRRAFLKNTNVAVQARRPIEWDAAAMRVGNFPEADQYLTKSYRPGFGV